ncbi:MAG: zinc-ribbon domain-containing protein [Candidatus Hodarchaeota archaeon]
MEEYIKFKILGVIILIISFILLFMARYGIFFIFNLGVGSFTVLVGFLFIAGKEVDIEIISKFIKAGFVLGLILWSISLIGSIYTIFWTQNQILLSSQLFIVIFTLRNRIIQPELFISMLFSFISGSRRDFNASIFRIIYIVSLYVLGSISFYEIKRTEAYEEVEREETYLIPHKKSQIERDLKNQCPNCYEVIQEGAKFCVHCGNKLDICNICKNYIKSEEQTAICPFCKIRLHKVEFLEWIKIKAACPVCKNEIDLWEFQKLEKK